MPKIFRAMKRAEDNLPELADSARGLGVRVPKDISVSDAGTVEPKTGGMSVASRPSGLDLQYIPKRLKHVYEGAVGPNTNVIWSHGEGAFEVSPIAPHLVLRPDSE